MGRANGDYGGYRGRRTITDVLKFIAAALAVLVVLVLAGTLYCQRYIVYTDEGPKLELPPFLEVFRREQREPNGSSSLPDPGDVSIIIDPDGSQAGVEAPPEAGYYLLELPVGDVTGGTAAARLEEAGAAALILQVKDSSGRLAWHSEQPAARRAEVNAPQSNNDALKRWNGGEWYTIARVCCFRDDSAPYFMNNLALRQGVEFNWRDELALRWLSPAHEAAQAYIAGLCGELAALGFDEIVLEQFHFPTRGKVEKINRGDRYDPDRFTGEMEEFLDQVLQAVGPYGTKVSLRVERDTLAGAESISGVTAELLERYAHRIWVEEDELLPTPLELIQQAGITGGAERLVSIANQRGEGGAVTQAVFAES